MSCLTPSRHPDTPESTRNNSQQCQVGDLGVFQVGQAAEFEGNLPAQLVVLEAQSAHASAVVGGDAIPGIDRFVAEPVGVVPPVRAFGGLVQRYQGSPVVCVGGLTDGAQPIADPVQPLAEDVVVWCAKPAL